MFKKLSVEHNIMCKCTIYSYLIVILFVFWLNLEIVKCDENSKYWNPEDIEIRKTNTRQKLRNIYERGILKPRHIRHSRVHKNNTKDDNLDWDPNFRVQSSDDRGQLRNKNAKVHSRRRSTRITAMYLMQKEGDEEKDTKTTAAIGNVLDLNELSPYFIKKQMEIIMSNVPEANSTVEVLGRTAEYNDIVLVKMTEQKRETSRFFRAEENKYIDEVPEKKIIFIVHGLSVMGIQLLPCMVKEKSFKILLSYYTTHLDKFDIFLMPLANPDGLSQSSQFIWNKNRSPQNACPGIALDRNFDVAWHITRSMSSCSQQFPGNSPFSEPETQAVRDVFHRYNQKIIAYFHVHAGTFAADVFKGDAVLYPKGFTDVTSDDDKYIDLKGEIEEAMRNASFQVLTVTVDTLHNWYGKVSGTSVDYAATVYGIPYSMELVMQLYGNSAQLTQTKNETDTYSYYALTEVWKRVIDVTINNIWKNTRTNDVQ